MDDDAPPDLRDPRRHTHAAGGRRDPRAARPDDPSARDFGRLCADLRELDGQVVRVQIGPTAASSAVPLFDHTGVARVTVRDGDGSGHDAAFRVAVDHVTIDLAADDHRASWRTPASLLIHTHGTEIEISRPPRRGPR